MGRPRTFDESCRLEFSYYYRGFIQRSLTAALSRDIRRDDVRERAKRVLAVRCVALLQVVCTTSTPAAEPRKNEADLPPRFGGPKTATAVRHNVYCRAGPTCRRSADVDDVSRPDLGFTDYLAGGGFSPVVLTSFSVVVVVEPPGVVTVVSVLVDAFSPHPTTLRPSRTKPKANNFAHFMRAPVFVV